MSQNFYSYAPNGGMQYHETGAEAKAAAEKAIRQLATESGLQCAGSAEALAKDIATITWGEVTERAAYTGAGHALKNALRLSYEAQYPRVIDGRMENGNGDLVLVKNVHDTDLIYDDLVLSIAVIWKSLAGKIERFKGYNFRDVSTVLSLLEEKFDVKRGGGEGNMTFFTFDRKFKLQIAIQKKIDFGPELQMAEKKLLEALDTMAANLTNGNESADAADMRTIVTSSFKLVDGKIRVSEVLRLRNNKINSALWNEGIDIIDEAIIVVAKKKQIRLYERNDQGAYVAIPLDIAAI